MKLISLEITDFRSFYGLHTLQLASSDEYRVTIFYGENGAGKTNLLNAIHWCVTGEFTPRFENRKFLVNKEAYREGRRQCIVELTFQDERSQGARVYRVRRSATNEKELNFQVFEIDQGNSKPIAKGDSLLRRILPPALISWFFFDAEAIGSLELSGSQSFKRDLRKTLGFDLVDQLLKDLALVKARRQREVAQQTDDRQLTETQDRIDDVNRVLSAQKDRLVILEREEQDLTTKYEAVRERLASQPQSKPLEEERRVLERRISQLNQDKTILLGKAADITGRAAPALFLSNLTGALEDRLQEQEVQGKLPSPYSDQLVKDILDSRTCVCGRPVEPGSAYADKIRDLMKFASTGVLNQRIGEVRFLIRDIERLSARFPLEISEIRERIANADAEIGRSEEGLADVKRRLDDIDLEEIRRLEDERSRLESQKRAKTQQAAVARHEIGENERRLQTLQASYDSASRRLQVSQKLKTELGKVKRLTEYIEQVLELQESKALLILSAELNKVLELYLTKHYQARIDPKTYAVELIDVNGIRVGHSTGEGQVLKFAFIATVVALAAKKTQQKIEWLSEPTIAPLVLDAPFSALDPEYQGSVAKNLAAQTTQLVLMISSAAWGEKVAQALEALVGRRYLIISKESGNQGVKPVKYLTLRGKQYALNQYGAERAESIFVEL
ncbi:AAA family ATPase [Burkholderia gladioli]|uniref:AAA family ATPase n=1 Tax=Burkholderia gladioli TaxID=28095 RepID=UPI001C20FE4E|nr:AAA family ATPase [Burkholderia gladioli]MBU9275734.1 AAA family ATPase [Burkholderia gladioli]